MGIANFLQVASWGRVAVAMHVKTCTNFHQWRICRTVGDPGVLLKVSLDVDLRGYVNMMVQIALETLTQAMVSRR